METFDRPSGADRTASASADKLTRFANVLGATFVGLIATGLLMWLNYRVMGGGGSGIVYLGAYLVAAALGYQAVKRLTDAAPASRFVLILLGLGAIGAISTMWQQIGFEDPFVGPAIFAVFVALAYWFTAPKTQESDS